MSGLLIVKILGVSLGLLNSIVLIIKGNLGVLKNYFLGWSLFTYSLFFLSFILLYELRFVLYFPVLIRVCSPLIFLAGPFFYFFIRNNLRNRTGLTRVDLLHFLPALLHVVNLIPLFSLSQTQKTELAEKILNAPYQLDILTGGFINSNLINALQVGQILSYFGICCFMIFKSENRSPILVGNPWIKSWTFISLLLVGGINLGYFGFRISNLFGDLNGLDLSQIQIYFSYLILFCIVVLSIFIHFNPEKVFGFELAVDPPKSIEKAANQVQPTETDLEPAGSSLDWQSQIFLNLPPELKNRILDIFEKEEVFKEQGLLVAELALRLGVTVKELNCAFRKFFNSDFKTFLNDYRTDYAKAKIMEGYLDYFTIEALGKQCGFNSRITFFNSFKKKFGKSPNEFWKDYQNS